MKPTDYAQAAGIGFAILIVDVLIAFGVVYFYAVAVNPGHPRAYYATAGIPIALWSTRVAGTALIFGASWLFGRRRPNRNAVAFALVIVIIYALLDAASGGFVDVLTARFALTIGLKVVGAVAGGLLGSPARKVAVPEF
jgi:hypothetical protein